MGILYDNSAPCSYDHCCDLRRVCTVEGTVRQCTAESYEDVYQHQLHLARGEDDPWCPICSGEVTDDCYGTQYGIPCSACPNEAMCEEED